MSRSIRKLWLTDRIVFLLCVSLMAYAYAGFMMAAAIPAPAICEHPVRTRYRKMRPSDVRLLVLQTLQTRRQMLRFVCWVIWSGIALWASESQINHYELGMIMGAAAPICSKASPRIDVSVANGTRTITFMGPLTIEIAEDNKDQKKALAVVLAGSRMPPVPRKTQQLNQSEIAAATGVSQTMVARWLNRFRESGIEGLVRLPRRKVLWPHAVIEQITIWQAEDLLATPTVLAARLNEANLLPGPATGEEIAAVLSQVDYNKVRIEIAKRWTKKTRDLPVAYRYLVERLFALNDDILRHAAVPKSILLTAETLRQLYPYPDEAGRGTYQWDRDQERPCAKVRQAMKREALQEYLQGSENAKPSCPVCGSHQVRIKQVRRSYPKDSNGIPQESLSVSYYCLNKGCARTTFTVPAADRELGAQVLKESKAKGLNMLFHLRGSLRHVADVMSNVLGGYEISATTLLRWVQELAAELVPWHELFEARSSGQIVVDEKWVKLRGQWFYVFIAVDQVSRDWLHVDVFPVANKDSAEIFLRQLKTMGYAPEVIVTDQMNGYGRAVRQVFPEARHRECLLHAERNARKAIFDTVGSRDDPRYEQLVEPLRQAFASKDPQSLKRAWQAFQAAHNGDAQLQDVIHRLQRFYPLIEHGAQHPNDPDTSNAVERVILEFDRKYRDMQAFSSFASLRAWCQLFQLYYRLRPYKRGRFAGQKPAEVLGHPVANLTWEDYVLGVLPSKESEANAVA